MWTNNDFVKVGLYKKKSGTPVEPYKWVYLLLRRLFSRYLFHRLHLLFLNRLLYFQILKMRFLRVNLKPMDFAIMKNYRKHQIFGSQNN